MQTGERSRVGDHADERFPEVRDVRRGVTDRPQKARLTRVLRLERRAGRRLVTAPVDAQPVEEGAPKLSDEGRTEARVGLGVLGNEAVDLQLGDRRGLARRVVDERGSASTSPGLKTYSCGVGPTTTLVGGVARGASTTGSTSPSLAVSPPTGTPERGSVSPSPTVVICSSKPLRALACARTISTFHCLSPLHVVST